MASVACRLRKQLLRCLLAATGLTAWFFLLLAAATPADAQVGSARYSSIVVDATSGDVLEEVNPDEPRHPASLTKMMTLYLTFEALRDRRIALDQAVPVMAGRLGIAGLQTVRAGICPQHVVVVEYDLAVPCEAWR